MQELAKRSVAKAWEVLGYKGVAALLAILIALIVLFQNTDPVKIDFLFWDALVVSKLVLILLCLALGLIVGVAVGWWLHARRTAPPKG